MALHPEDAKLESVVGGARNPLNWLARAEGHMKASEALSERWANASQRLHLQGMQIMARLIDPPPPTDQIDLFDETIGYGFGAMFHRSLAVENLLKGILVKREPEVWVKANPKRLYEWGHDIRELAAAVHIDLTADEDGVPDNLTRLIMWAGRYPTAMTPEAHGDGASWSTDQVRTVTVLTDRLRTILREESGLKP